MWDFDDGTGLVATDISGYDNEGTLNGPVWKCASDDHDYTPLGRGCSLQFDGINDYVRTANSNNLPSGTQDFTISVWVKPLVLAGDFRLILANQNLDHFQLNLGDEGTSAKIAMSLGGDYPGCVKTASLSWALGKWYHIAVTRRNGTVKIYRDAKEEASGTQNLPITKSVIDIGYRTSDGEHPWNGFIDDVRIYEEALTQVKIEQLYVQGSDKYYLAIDPSSLVKGEGVDK